MTAAVRPVSRVRVGSREYAVDGDGWCAQLGCWVFRDRYTGRLVTVPAD